MFNGRKVLDIHGHVSAPISLYSPILLMMASNTPLPSLVRTGPIPPIVEYDLGVLEPAAEHHIRQLDHRNIDVQVLLPRGILQFGWVEPHLMVAASELVNDLIEAQCNLGPNRFLGAAQLPQNPNAPDSQHMLAELNRCVGELGFVAVCVSPDPAGQRSTPGMHTRYWDALYERAATLDVPIIVHASPDRDSRLTGLMMNYQLGLPGEHYIARESFIRGHVFDRHPDLRVLVCHCGGPPDRYLKNDAAHSSPDDLTGSLFYDTCAYDEDFLTAIIRQRGVENLCFGTEVPGGSSGVRRADGTRGDDLVPVLDGFDWLTADDKDVIFHDNPMRLCKGLASLL